MPTTQEQISQIILAAEQMILQARKDASSGKASTSLKETILSYSNEIQSALNKLLSKTGVVTDQEINNLDEQLRLAKKNIEYRKAQETKNKFIITISLLTIGFGALWFITKSKK